MKKLLALILGILLLIVPAQADTVKDLTSSCKISVSTGSARHLKDKSVTTYWTAKNDGDSVLIELPENADAGGMEIEWYSEPEDFQLTEYSSDGNILSQRTQDDVFLSILHYFPLNSQTRRIILGVSANTKISTIRLCTQGELPASVQTWEPPVNKADVMLVSTHQDDEELFFGGTIPYYDLVRDKNVQVVYMASCGRKRRKEALTGLWAMGMRNYPEFLNLKDKRVSSIDEGIQLWGGKDEILEKLVYTIRKYRPEVIVTHDLDGEYGHNQHKITARAMEYAIVAAADPERYPDSLALYGAWQVKKLYLHLASENPIRMNWSLPSDALGGKTPLEVAKIGFSKHKSQQEFFNMDVQGVKYDNTRFGLTYSVVGPDILKNDFLENIPEESAEPAQEALAPIQSTDSATITASPTVHASAVSGSTGNAGNDPIKRASISRDWDADTEQEDTNMLPALIGIAAAVLLCVLALTTFEAMLFKRRHPQHRRNKR